MYVRYGRTGQRAAYVCSWQRSDYGLPLCQSTSAEAVEGWLAEQILAALQPAALAASLTAAAEVEGRRREQIRNWEQRLERARFEADRAGRQYHACEPENRLVGRTLERRWDEALREVQRLEAEFEGPEGLAAAHGPADGVAPRRADARTDCSGPGPGGVPAAEAVRPVHGRDGAAVIGRTRVASASAAVYVIGKPADRRRAVAERTGR
jgi:hypothetical protein